MAKIFDRIDDSLRGWIAQQALFFVGTSPLSAGGHVNVSPKGPIGSLRVLDDRTVAYVDVLGSGAETIAHLRENGRIVVMFCAFKGAPRILRLHGRGEVVLAGDHGFRELLEAGDFVVPGVEQAMRAIVRVDVHRIADACGFGVPLMTYDGERSHMRDWGKVKLAEGDRALHRYRTEKNTRSIDGLPAIDESET